MKVWVKTYNLIRGEKWMFIPSENPYYKNPYYFQNRLKDNTKVVIDTETTGLNWLDKQAFILGVVFNDVIMISDDLEKDALFFNDFFKHNLITEIWAQNTKFDFHMLKNVGINLPAEKLRDRMILFRHTQEQDFNTRLALTKGKKGIVLHEAWLKAKLLYKKEIDKKLAEHNYSLKEYEYAVKNDILKVPQNLIQFFKKIYYQGHFDYGFQHINKDLVTDYLKEDLIQTEKDIKDWEPELSPESKDIFEKDCALISIFAKHEREGLPVDNVLLNKYLLKYQRDMKKSLAMFYDTIHAKIKPSCHKQLLARMQEVFTYSRIKSTNQKELQTLYKQGDENYDFFYEALQKIRNLQKIYTTYLVKFYIEQHNNKIYTNYKISGTITGRVSSNLQQIPNKEKTKGYDLRSLFITDEKQPITLFFDYSQIEMRMTALISILYNLPEKNMIEAFTSDKKDLHSLVAKNAGLDPKIDRHLGKTANFLLLYGGGKKLLATHFPNVGKDIIERIYIGFKKTYPNLERLRLTIFQRAYYQKCLVNIFLKEYYFKNWVSVERDLLNYIVQGSCAYLLKTKIIELENYINKHKLKMKIIYNLHDEIQAKTSKDELNHIPAIKLLLETTKNNWMMPFEVDINYTKTNWSDKESLKWEN